MSLIAILISLALEKFLPAIDSVRRLNWFTHYADWVRVRLNPYPRLREIPALLLTVLLPVIIIAVVQALFDDILKFLGFLFGIAVLTYCLGPQNPLYAVNRYLDTAEEDDSEEARLALEALLADHATDAPTDLHENLVSHLLIETHERIIGILFWFILLGPIGAVLYRLTVDQARQERQSPQENNPGYSAAALKLHSLLAWIPAHLTALSYAVMGSFTHALHAWQPANKDDSIEITHAGQEPPEESHTDFSATPASHRLLTRIGLGALLYDEKPITELQAVKETFGLCSRALITWLTVLALLTLAGWIA